MLMVKTGEHSHFELIKQSKIAGMGNQILQIDTDWQHVDGDEHVYLAEIDDSMWLLERNKENE